MVRQADLARARHALPAADQSRVGNGVMRRAKRPVMQKAAASPQNAGDAVDLGGLDGLGEGQRRQGSRETLGQHRLPGTGRADHQDVVRTGGRHFQRPFGHGLAPDVAKIERGACFHGQAVSIRPGGNEVIRTGQHGNGFRQAFHAVHVHSLDDGRLARIFHRDDQVGDAVLAGAHRYGQCAANGAEGAIERQFAHQDVAVERAGVSHRAQNAERHGQVEACALLAYVGGSQVDGDALIGITESGIDECGLDALAAFADRHIGHTNHSGVARRA